MKKIVILGGGYGGFTVAKELSESKIPADAEIILLDRSPFLGLKTEYYALAAGTVAESEIRVPFHFHDRISTKYGEIAEINLELNTVAMHSGERIAYDYAVISLGCVDNYHGIEGAQEHTLSLQTFSSVRKAYQQINDVKPYGTVSIVGGGLSGVELASELRYSRPDLNVRIIDHGPTVLSMFPKKLSDYVHDWFVAHDVELCNNISINRVEKGALYHAGKPFATDATVWTAGITPSPLVQQLNVPKDKLGRILLNEHHQIAQFPNVFVVGDCASAAFSPSAQLAEAQGKQVAEVICAIWDKREPRLGKIKLKGVLGSLGKKSGFGLLGKDDIIVTGWTPKLLKSGVLWMSKRNFA
ncbi:MAG TPA: NAD(P)/FAD-dependent oxidoreductase [Bacilli bacterium]